MDNATTGLNVLFQRGVGPSHILLLQEIRVHNSPVHGAQPIAHQKELHLCWQTRSGARQRETESLPRKLCFAHESTNINGKCSCQTLCSSMSNGLHINHLMSSYVLLQKSSHLCSAPSIFQSLTPVISLFSCPLLGLSTFLTSPLHGHHPLCDLLCLHQRRSEDKGSFSCMKQPPQSPSATGQFIFCLWESSRWQAGNNS